MNLIAYCNKISKNETNLIWDDEKIGHQIMCPEYAIDKVDVKSFPVSDGNGIFMLCWNVEKKGRFYASLKPSKNPFAYSSSFESGDKTQLHTHDYIELAYVVDGEFQQRILGKDIKFKKGEFCLIDKNCLHQDYLFDHGSIVIFIGLANDIFDEVMVEKIGEERLLNFFHTALLRQKDIQQYLHFKPKSMVDKQIEDMLCSLISELEKNDEASKYICKGLLIRILHFISAEYEFHLSNEQRKKMNWIIFDEITKFIKDNYANITIRDLVEKFHFNEDYYNRILKEKTGMTYLEYVQNIRLTEAERLLLTTNMNINEIAEAIGYQNKGYLYKIFVEKNSVTPAKYRKQAANRVL